MLGGCASSGWLPPLKGKSETIAASDAAFSVSGSVPRNALAPAQPRSSQAQAAKLAQEFDQGKKAATYPGAKTAKKITSVFGQVADSLTPDPRVIPAKDPTRLSSDPGPLGSELYVSSARLLEHQGKNEQAATNYRKALEADPRCRDALIGYARLEHRTGNLAEAVRLYRLALENEPRDATALNDLGLCLARQGQLDQAIATTSRAVQVDPSSVRYRNNLATLLIDARRPDEALAHLEQAHGRAKALHNVGYLLKQRGEPQLAMRYLAKAIEVDPTLDASRNMLAEMSRATPVRPSGDGPARWAARQESPATARPETRLGTRPTHSWNRPASYQAEVAPEPPDVLTQGDGTPMPPSPQYVPQSRLRVGPFGYEPR
jgi:tetratricopeptide (TPR) repeat protein